MRHWIAVGLLLLAFGANAAPAPSEDDRSSDFSEEDIRKLLETDLDALKAMISATLGAGTSSIQRNATRKDVRKKAA